MHVSLDLYSSFGGVFIDLFQISDGASKSAELFVTQLLPELKPWFCWQARINFFILSIDLQLETFVGSHAKAKELTTLFTVMLPLGGIAGWFLFCAGSASDMD